MKYKILYSTRISTKNYKAGDEIEFAEGTDELFIKRLIDIKCIEPVAGSEKPKEPKNQRGTNVKEQEKQGKKQEKQGKKQAVESDDDLGVDLDDIEE
ncbi:MULTISPECIES: hypothetical protein [Campylobacter]|uniref:hypothetical protein n=1 Tax=Campylobacter TaxID=194 RepID=UPI00027A374C|nr:MULTISPECIES: hypothetical protein [Campylobacter]EJP74591.1 hypothetical protein HMPREF1139_1262 [Campylobacter sp. FOBRC14]